MSEVCNSKLITTDKEQFDKNLIIFSKDYGAFKPVEPKDFRVSSVLPKWLELVG